jgi:hypothetical protein
MVWTIRRRVVQRSLISFLPSFVTLPAISLLLVPLAVLLLRGALALRSFFLALRPWRLLLTLGCPLLWLLPLILD